MPKKNSFLDHLDNSHAILAIRQGLIMTIPLLMIGSFALILKFLPVDGYQRFLANFAGGMLPRFFTVLNQATFDMLALCITISISVCYTRQKTSQLGSIFGAAFSALSTYLILNGFSTEFFNKNSFAAQGMFTAIFSAIAASVLFCYLIRQDLFSFRLYTVGADSTFNSIIAVIFPTCAVIFAALLFNMLIQAVFDVNTFDELFHATANRLFSLISNSFVQTLLFVLMSGVFWFFGIHGTNVLESVSQNIFSGNAEVGSQVAEVFSKNFMDVFVFMGGCGTTLSLLIAILLFSRQKNVRSLSKMALFPMLFNINELMVFGLPIVFNASFFIPFLLTPLACTITSYIAITIGLVPPPVYAIEWVTPVGIGGYVATGSIAGSLLQLFNLTMGVFIYRWFLLWYEKKTNRRMMEDLNKLCDILRDAETNGIQVDLLELKGSEGSVARTLAEDLRHVLKTRDSFQLFYQPQYDYEGTCIGAEALLRWNHPLCGFIYPPLLISLAQETGQLGELEQAVFALAREDTLRMLELDICPRKVSVNATTASLQDDTFVTFLHELLEQDPEVRERMTIELTEQMSFLLSENAEKRLNAIRETGIRFAIDDFSMGHTSIKYLQSNLFELVKLDGSLVKDMVNNPRSQEIISSIVHMSRSMGFRVIAEYVETEQQRDMLQKLGCNLYQGYLYSPAVPLEKLIARLQSEAADRADK